jgi:hypothetical protein
MSGAQVKHVESEVNDLNAKLANPLAGFTHAELVTKAEEYCRSHDIEEDEDIRAFRLGAIIAQVRICIARLQAWPYSLSWCLCLMH